ncbi:hypothetical protein XANCAGTX0491_000798 [Xanthoria calcicola]
MLARSLHTKSNLKGHSHQQEGRNLYTAEDKVTPTNPLQAKDLLLGSSDNTTEERSESPSLTNEQATPQSPDLARNATCNQLIEKQQITKWRRLLQNLKKRLYHLGIALSIGKKVRRTQALSVEICAHPDGGVKVPAMEADQTLNTSPSAAKSDKPSERVPGEAEHPRTSHCHSPAQILQSTGRHTEAVATKDSITADHSGPEGAANYVPLSSSVGPSRWEQDRKSGRDKQDTMEGVMLAHQDQPLGPTTAPTHGVVPMAGEQTPAVADRQPHLEMVTSVSETPQGRKWKSWFHMVILLANGTNAQRVASLDTGSDLDVISIHVVDSLKLKKEPYLGPSLTTIGSTYRPEWQVTFDWHVANFRRTYTGTFAVLDAKHSGDFDMLLGKATVEDKQFYYMNNNVWFNKRNNEEMTPSLGFDDAKHILPSVKVAKPIGE